jgi:hypothetical protein
MKSIFIFFAIAAGGRLFGAEPINLINQSSRVTLFTGGPGVIIGMVTTNTVGLSDNPKPIRLLVRASGPSARIFGISTANEVALTVFGGSGTRVISTWANNRASIASAADSVGAFPYTAPSGDDAVLIETSGGALTISVLARGVGGESVVEAYRLPDPPSSIPAAPTGLVVTRAIGFGITLDWDDNKEANLSRYAIYRGLSNDPKAAGKIGENSSSQYTDAGLVLGVRYYYWVTAIALGLQEGPKSNPTSGVPNAGI